MKKIVLIICTILISLIILAGYVKGSSDLMYYQSAKDTALGGPFEASNSTARYALTEAIVNNHSLFLTTSLAKFASPDVVDYKGKFTSIFTPGISFLGVPFFALGNIFGYPQLFTYFLTLIFALTNVYLIAVLSKKFGTGFVPGLIGGFVFLFASNGLSYAFTFTQHHASTTIVLLALLTAIDKNSWKKSIIFGVLFGIGVLIDIPNAFFLTPISVYMLAKTVTLEKVNEKIQLLWKPVIIGTLIGIIPFIMVFGWYNYTTNGSVVKLGQTIGRSKLFRANQPPRLSADSPSTVSDLSKPIGLKLPFETRAELSGMYILLLSNERSWLYYSPILLFGILGFYLTYKSKEKRSIGILMAAVILIDIVSYSMFGDPWGGWAFGPRYLIPSAALMAVFCGVVLDKFKKNPVFMLFFFGILLYSTWVNSLGTLTTTAIPPKVEAVNLPSHIPYTYKYNQQLLQTNFSGSLIYNAYLKNSLNELQYLLILFGSTITFFIGLYAISLLAERGDKK